MDLLPSLYTPTHARQSYHISAPHMCWATPSHTLQHATHVALVDGSHEDMSVSPQPFPQDVTLKGQLQQQSPHCNSTNTPHPWGQGSKKKDSTNQQIRLV